MQDVHWAAGSFGYFPTYALGNVIAAQLWELAAAELGDLDELIAARRARRAAPLADRAGAPPRAAGCRRDLATEALGGPLDPAPLLARLRSKYGEIYGF